MTIKWCKCSRRILTSRQQENNLPCDVCQKELNIQHTKDFHEKFDLKKEEK